jgi:hypothetical protein
MDVPTLVFSIESVTLQTKPETVTASRLVWKGEREESIRELTADDGSNRVGVRGPTKSARTSTLVGDAADWLIEYLDARAGSALAEDIRREGEAAGYSERTLQRAANNLGIQKLSTREWQRKHIWALPTDDRSS